MSTLTQLLAKESFFGEDVMVQCTTYGYGGNPGLPKKELDELKETIEHYILSIGTHLMILSWHGTSVQDQ